MCLYLRGYCLLRSLHSALSITTQIHEIMPMSYFAHIMLSILIITAISYYESTDRFSWAKKVLSKGSMGSLHLLICFSIAPIKSTLTPLFTPRVTVRVLTHTHTHTHTGSIRVGGERKRREGLKMGGSRAKEKVCVHKKEWEIVRVYFKLTLHWFPVPASWFGAYHCCTGTSFLRECQPLHPQERIPH